MQRSHAWPITPPVLLALAFLLLIGLGAALLKLPFATEGAIEWHAAFFTATSAVTVTGLEVIETGPSFDFWGELVLLLLIQSGGLGLMTLAVVALLVLGERISAKPGLVTHSTMNHTSPADLWRTARAVITMALVVEVMAVFPLAWVWVPQYGWLQGIWWAIFHAVSGFNNAGFALAPNNLSEHAGQPLVTLTISSLYILGGLGFAVIASLLNWHRSRHLDTNARVVLLGTVMLSVLATAMIYMLESGNPQTLGGLPGVSERLWASWLEATTPRTAGFNSLDTADLTQPTSIVQMLLMFIGASANGTGGGIKVTTSVVLLAATWAFIRRRQTPTLFSRTIGHGTLIKALAVMVTAMMGIFMGIFALSLTERADFLSLSFEVVSAMGTVGLSRGLTENLSLAGQMIIMTVMFVGRLCPLTMAYFVASARPPEERTGQAEIQIG